MVLQSTIDLSFACVNCRDGVRRGIDRKKVGCRSLIDANLDGQVGVNKFKLYRCKTLLWVNPSININININYK